VSDVRVIAVRELAALNVEELRSLAVDGEARTDGTGVFSVRGVPQGNVRVFAVADDGRVSAAVPLALNAGANTLDAALELVDLLGERPLQLVVSPVPTGTVTIDVFVSGQARTTSTRFTREGGGELSISLPPGLYDFVITSDAGTGSLLRQPVVPISPEDNGVQRLGIVLLASTDGCAATIEADLDLDGDGARATDDSSCAAACASTFDDPAARCTVDGKAFD
jgi:hypothetical protein